MVAHLAASSALSLPGCKNFSGICHGNANRVERLPGIFKERTLRNFLCGFAQWKRKRSSPPQAQADISRFDLDQLAKVADGFSGAEIEQALIAAMYEAFAQDREFTIRYVLQLNRRCLCLDNDRAGNSLRDWASSVPDLQRAPLLNTSAWSFKAFSCYYGEEG